MKVSIFLYSADDHYSLLEFNDKSVEEIDNFLNDNIDKYSPLLKYSVSMVSDNPNDEYVSDYAIKLKPVLAKIKDIVK